MQFWHFHGFVLVKFKCHTSHIDWNICHDDLGVCGTHFKWEKGKRSQVLDLSWRLHKPLFSHVSRHISLILTSFALRFWVYILDMLFDKFALDMEALYCLIIMQWGLLKRILFALFWLLMASNSLYICSLSLGMSQHYLDSSSLNFWVLNLIIW